MIRAVRPALAAAVSAALFAGLAAGEARWDSATIDEPVYVDAAFRLGQGKPDGNVEHPPLAKLLMLAGQRLLAPPRPVPDPPGALFWNSAGGLLASRTPMIALGALFCVLTTLWAARAAPGAAWPAALLAATSPSLLAHGHLATLDICLALAFAAACLAAEALAERPTPWRALAVALAVGAAVSTKWTGAVLLGALPLAAFAAADGGLGRRIRSSAVVLGAAAAGLGVLVLLYAATVGLPRLAEGVRWQLEHARHGHEVLLFGKVLPRGAWWYFLAALALKTPLALFPLAAAGAGALRRRTFLWLPAALLFAALSLGPVQLGIRYVLPIYLPLLAASGAGAARLWASAEARWAAPLLAAAAVASSLAAFPRHVEYQHEARHLSRWYGYDWLGDSDGDWGQGAKALAEDAAAMDVGRLCVAWFGLPTWRFEPVLAAHASEAPACDTAAVSATWLFRRPGLAPFRAERPLDRRGPVFLFDVRGRPELQRIAREPRS
jgi:Dolichyl-phosphate-mannose-protein mannosyltransferase